MLVGGALAQSDALVRDMQVFVLLMVTSLGVMGIITPYGTGPSPIYLSLIHIYRVFHR